MKTKLWMKINMRTKMEMKMRTPAVQRSRCCRSKLPPPRPQPEKVGRVERVASLCFPLEVHFTRMAGMAKVAVAKRKNSRRSQKKNLARAEKVVKSQRRRSPLLVGAKEAVERRKSQRRPLARAEKVAQMKKPTTILAMITLKRRGVQERVKEAREVALRRRK